MHTLNQAMDWPGIQHPHQTAWNTKLDSDFKGKEHFTNLAAVERWQRKVAARKRLAARYKAAGQQGEADYWNEKATAKSKDVPTGNIAEGRDLNLVDKNLTVLAAGGGVQLSEFEDYWNALACCGCLATDPDNPKQEQVSDEAADDPELRDAEKDIQYSDVTPWDKK
jgi:hypothetical protein